MVWVTLSFVNPYATTLFLVYPFKNPAIAGSRPRLDRLFEHTQDRSLTYYAVWPPPLK